MADNENEKRLLILSSLKQEMTRRSLFEKFSLSAPQVTETEYKPLLIDKGNADGKQMCVALSIVKHEKTCYVSTDDDELPDLDDKVIDLKPVLIENFAAINDNKFGTKKKFLICSDIDTCVRSYNSVNNAVVISDDEEDDLPDLICLNDLIVPSCLSSSLQEIQCAAGNTRRCQALHLSTLTQNACECLTDPQTLSNSSRLVPDIWSVYSWQVSLIDVYFADDGDNSDGEHQLSLLPTVIRNMMHPQTVPSWKLTEKLLAALSTSIRSWDSYSLHAVLKSLCVCCRVLSSPLHRRAQELLVVKLEEALEALSARTDGGIIPGQVADLNHRLSLDFIVSRLESESGIASRRSRFVSSSTSKCDVSDVITVISPILHLYKSPLICLFLYYVLFVYY